MYTAAQILPYVDRAIPSVHFPDHMTNRRSGKVREGFDSLSDPRIRILVATDRLSAFDRHIVDVPYKGQALTTITRTAFELLDAENIMHHALSYPDPNIMVVEKLDIIPVEIVVRAFMAGNTSTALWTLYEAGKADVYGYHLPEGIKLYDVLPERMITPTTKSDDHDVPLSSADVVASGIVTQSEWDYIAATALRIFKIGEKHAAQKGLILADTKYEFGRNANGQIVLADEIHTPDSSRYWFFDTYAKRRAVGKAPESFDKDVIRTWIAERCDPYKDAVPPVAPEMVAYTASVYLNMCERLTGTAIDIHCRQNNKPGDRLQENINALLMITGDVKRA